ncbi:MAG: GreA/GreB family elongation factor [Sphingomonadaceae bacterium]
MRVAQPLLLTEKGWRELQEELLSLQRQRTTMMSEYMNAVEGGEQGDALASGLRGDISSINRRIAQLDEVLSRAVPVGPGDRVDGEVGVGSSVVVRWEDGQEESYVIVGPPEVDLSTGRISYESPVGRALMGSRAGRWVEVETPGGVGRLFVVSAE